MTDTSTEADEATTTTARPVRVPNVSPGAISGLGHQVIGAAAQDGASYGDTDDSPHVTDLDPDGSTVEGTQAPAGPDSSLTGDGTPQPADPTNGALPTDTYTVADYTVDQVNDYLDQYPAATEQVLAAEADGQARKGILHGRHGTPETA